jgi:hypothetical protein
MPTEPTRAGARRILGTKTVESAAGTGASLRRALARLLIHGGHQPGHGQGSTR